MNDFNLFDPLRAFVRTGAPVWGTCAGMIVLAQHASDLEYPTLEAIDISVLRNAYGRQVDSFEADIDISALGREPFHAVFIRAPVVESVGRNVQVLAAVRDEHTGEEQPVVVRQGHLLATSFHPELTNDRRMHSYFLKMVREASRSSSPK
jgi:5'-phosphate synthase pdxT subunit